ncbi:MAG: pseudouridine synthase [Rikenellaceae bacterium]
MRSFDNNDRPQRGGQDRFNREDSSRSQRSGDNAMQFRKDKRAHKTTSKVERVEPSSRQGGSYEKSNQTSNDQSKRRSFNPNFSADNKFLGEKRSERSDSRSSFKPKGEWKPKGDFKAKGDWKPREERGEGGYKKFDKKPYSSDRKFDKKGSYGKTQGKYDATNYPRFNSAPSEKPIRLNRYLAISGICSRREADDLILAGVVSINGEIVTELGTKVLSSDEVKFNDSLVKGEKKVYILMNKPKGFVTTIEDPHADRTVIDLVKNLCQERVYPVGRLDKNSLGVLLITNDGDLTRTLTHPSYEKKKIYQVSLDKPLTRADLEQIGQGITLEDGPIAADAISYVGDSKKEIGVEIHSGRNRIIRRIFESLGYRVQKLDRVYFAGLTKKNLKRGEWRFLAPSEVSMLKSGEYQ